MALAPSHDRRAHDLHGHLGAIALPLNFDACTEDGEAILMLEQCASAAEAMTQAWPGFLDGPPPADLDRSVAYRNSKGEPWTSTVGDILTHVVTHSAYHRGQVASELRAAGFEPAYTDFIHAVRQGFLPVR